MITALVLGVTITAAPSLIVLVIVLIGLFAWTHWSERQNASTLNQIRRCPQCGQIAGEEATTCRHCEQELT